MLQSFTQHAPVFVVDLARLCAWLAILGAIFVPLEHLFAVHPSKIWRKGIGADLGYYFLGGAVASLLLSVPLGAMAWAAHRFVPHHLLTAFSGAPFWTRAFAALLAGETGYYWGHRLMHCVPLLWRFHAIHHNPEHVDFLVNSRAHPIDLVFSRLCAFAPMLALGLVQPVVAGGSIIPLLVVLVGKFWSFFIHANLRWRFGALEWVISTPGFHHWHHAKEPANKNFASMLPILDRIFGTMHMPRRQWPSQYGIAGVVPDSWIEQLVYPLLGSFPLTRAERLDPVQPTAEVSS